MIKTSFLEWVKNRKLQEGMGRNIPRKPGVNLNQSLSDSGFEDLSGEEEDEASVKRKPPMLTPKFGQRKRPEVFVDPAMLDQLPDRSGKTDFDVEEPFVDDEPDMEPMMTHGAHDVPNYSNYEPDSVPRWRPSRGRAPLSHLMPEKPKSVALDTAQDDLEHGDFNPGSTWDDVEERKKTKSWKDHRPAQRHHSGHPIYKPYFR